MPPRQKEKGGNKVNPNLALNTLQLTVPQPNSAQLMKEAFEEMMRTHPFTAEQQINFDDLKALLEKASKLKITDEWKAKEPVDKETCTTNLDKQRERSEEQRLLSLQQRREARKGLFKQNPDSFVEDPHASLFPSPSPLWPRPELTNPVSSSTALEVSNSLSTPLPSKVYTITQTTFASYSTPKTLCLCTSVSAAKTFLSHLANEMASRPVFYVPEGAKRALRTYRVIREYGGEKKYKLGFAAWVEEGGDGC